MKKVLTVTEIMDAVHDGEIHGMYILGENPAMSDPRCRACPRCAGQIASFGGCRISLSPRLPINADVILPASAFAEKSGTVTNTNRQVQMGSGSGVTSWRGAGKTGGSRVELAKRLGLNWTYTSPAQVV